MIQIILNEKKYAENIINKKTLSNTPSTDLYLLAKYYRQVLNMGPKTTYKELMRFMEENNTKGFIPALWEGSIMKFANKGKKPDIREMEYIGINQYEINMIKNIEDAYQRLVFTLLCFSKYHLTVSNGVNPWISESMKDIFDIAGFKVRYSDERYKVLHELRELGIIDVTKNGTAKIRVNNEYINMGGDPIIKISDFRELGNEWDNYLGKAKYVRCECCGRLIRKITNNMKYCKDCKRNKQLEWQRESMNKLRNELCEVSETP